MNTQVSRPRTRLGISGVADIENPVGRVAKNAIKRPVKSSLVQKRAAFGEVTNTISNIKASDVLKKKQAITKNAGQNRVSGTIVKRSTGLKPLTTRTNLPTAITNSTRLTKSVLSSVSSNKSQRSSTVSVPEEKDSGFVDRECPSFSQSRLVDLGAEDVDKADCDDILLFSEYARDIYGYLMQLESQYLIRPGFLSDRQITSRMRALLVDWLTQVALRFNLVPETIYMTVSILDRYLQEVDVPKSELQLTGVAAMFIAAKYEEMMSPEVTDFSYMCDGGCAVKSILKKEQQILQTLSIELGKPLPLHFLRRYSKCGGANTRQHGIAKYLMELSLVEKDLLEVKPSLLAASALSLSFRLTDDCQLSDTKPWSGTLEFYSTYSIDQLESTVQKLAEMLSQAETSKYQAVRKKYSSRNQNRIALDPCITSTEKVAEILRSTLAK